MGSTFKPSATYGLHYFCCMLRIISHQLINLPSINQANVSLHLIAVVAGTCPHPNSSIICPQVLYEYIFFVTRPKLMKRLLESSGMGHHHFWANHHFCTCRRFAGSGADRSPSGTRSSPAKHWLLGHRSPSTETLESAVRILVRS